MSEIQMKVGIFKKHSNILLAQQKLANRLRFSACSNRELSFWCSQVSLKFHSSFTRVSLVSETQMKVEGMNESVPLKCHSSFTRVSLVSETQMEVGISKKHSEFLLAQQKLANRLRFSACSNRELSFWCSQVSLKCHSSFSRE